jgi:hypothetical protein
MTHIQTADRKSGETDQRANHDTNRVLAVLTKLLEKLVGNRHVNAGALGHDGTERGVKRLEERITLIQQARCIAGRDAAKQQRPSKVLAGSSGLTPTATHTEPNEAAQPGRIS